MKKYFLNLVSSHLIFFLISSFVILGLNLTPMVKQILHTPPGRTFALIHNNVQDFFFYESLMNEGAHGSLLTTNPYTTEPHRPSIIFAYFLWLGRLSKLFGLSYALSYHLTRIVLAILLLLAAYYVILLIKIPHPRLVFLFFLFASPLMHTINDTGKLTTVPYMNWWTGVDPIRRIAYLPHHMLGGLLLLISIILIMKYIKIKQKKYLFLLTGLTIPMAFVHPPSLFIILITLPVAVIIHQLTSKLTKNAKQPHQVSNWSASWRIGLLDNWVIGLFFYWFIGLLVLLIMVSQTNQGFPWSQYITWESKLQFPLDKELLGALGILTPFALLGVISALVLRKFNYILIACWLAVPLLLIPFAPYLNISNIRFIQGVPYLPLAILAVLGIEVIISNLESLRPRRISLGLKISKLHLKSKNWEKFIGLLGYWVIGLLFLVSTLPTFVWSLKDQIREYWPIFGNVYLDNRLNSAFSFIDRSFPAKTVTLSTFYTGNYLPAFTNTRSFIGHFGYTYNIDEKQKQVQRFFENKMSSAEASDFITNNKIALIFQGPEEKPIYNNYLYPSILKPIYDREEVTLYTLK